MNRLILAAALGSMVALSSCQDDAKIVTDNLIKAADNFEINRRIVFINGITDQYLLEIVGRCSMGLNNGGTAFNAVCKIGPNSYKRHTLVLSDNSFAMVEQLDAVEASAYHYRVTFKPQQILPDVDFRGDAEELIINRN